MKHDPPRHRIGAFDGGGLRFLAGGWRTPAPPGIAYYRNNATLPLVALAVVAVLPELFVVELFVGRKPWPIHALDIAIHGYAIFWFVALYASFRDRPHTLAAETAVFRRGLFDTVRVPFAAIEHVAAVPPMERSTRRALPKDAAYLGLMDSALIEIRVSEACTVERALRPPRLARVLYLAADDPVNAVAAIESARRARTRNAALRM